MTDLVVRTDRGDLSARFNLSAFVTDWEAARKTFIACIVDAFREPLNPRPEDFSTALPAELGEAWCKYRMFGGSSTIVLRADSLTLTFPNIVKADITVAGEVLRRSLDVLLPTLGSYDQQSYNVVLNGHASVVEGNSEQYLAQHASANIETPAIDSTIEYRPCIGFSLRSSDGYRVLRRTIEQSEVLHNGLFISDHVFVRMPKLTKFEEEMDWMVQASSMADRAAGIAYQKDSGDDAARP